MKLKDVTVRWEGPFNEAKDDAEMYCMECDYNLDYGAEDWNYCPNCGLKLIYRPEPAEYTQRPKDTGMLRYLVHFKAAGSDGRAVMLTKSHPTGSTIELWESQLRKRHGNEVIMVVSFTPLAEEESEDADVSI